ncbi:hypothetical protein KBD34_01360 [Patescibacteria group bacterium]|nr:hypothetical protein [Patescibacteria group bacterium]
MKATLTSDGSVVTFDGCGTDIAPLLRALRAHRGGGGIALQVSVCGGMKRVVRLSDINLDPSAVNVLNPKSSRPSLPGDEPAARMSDVPALEDDGRKSGTVEIPVDERHTA